MCRQPIRQEVVDGILTWIRPPIQPLLTATKLKPIHHYIVARRASLSATYRGKPVNQRCDVTDRSYVVKRRLFHDGMEGRWWATETKNKKKNNGRFYFWVDCCCPLGTSHLSGKTNSFLCKRDSNRAELIDKPLSISTDNTTRFFSPGGNITQSHSETRFRSTLIKYLTLGKTRVKPPMLIVP